MVEEFPVADVGAKPKESVAPVIVSPAGMVSPGTVMLKPLENVPDVWLSEQMFEEAAQLLRVTCTVSA